MSRRYSAFISYTDADRARVLRLQSRLEAYRLPARLAKRLGRNRIGPVFVDRSEMRAAADLSQAIRDALARSGHLIVACTPRTPASRWVGREIEAFRELHGGSNILAALLEGSKPESFHPALLAGAGEDGEPLAADFRKEGDGDRLALLKILAVLLDVELDDLVHRDRARKRLRTAILSAMAAILALVIGILAVLAYSADRAVDQEKIRASQAMERQLNELRDKIRAGGTLDMAAAINRNVELFYDGMPASDRLPEVDLGRAQLLQAKADDDARRGKLKQAAASARSAWNISSRVISQRPNDARAIFVHAQSAYHLGYVAWRLQDTPLAANAFARYADLADRLARTGPENDDWRLEQGYAYSNLGMLALSEARDPARAQRYFEAAQQAFREVARRNPGKPEPVYELADGEAWLADAMLAQNDFASAMQHRETQKRLLDELLEHDPGNLLYRADSVAAQIGRARLDAAMGRYTAAIRRFGAAHRDADALLAEDPANGLVRNQKRATELFQARSELELARSDPGALRRAEQLISGCGRDWAAAPGNELSAFCSLLEARAALLRGQPARARAILAAPRVRAWLASPTLSPNWRLDFREECYRLGQPEMCRPPRQ